MNWEVILVALFTSILGGGGTVAVILKFIEKRRQDRAKSKDDLIDDLSRRLDRLEAKNEKLEGQVDLERAARRQVENDLAAECIKRENLETQLEKESQERQKLEALFGEERRLRIAAEAKVDKLTVDLESRNGRIRILESQIATLQGKLEKLEKKTGELKLPPQGE